MFLVLMIFLDLLVKQIVIRDFIIIDAGIHIGAPERASASPAPIAPAAIAYGVGNKHAATKINESPICTYPLPTGI